MDGIAKRIENLPTTTKELQKHVLVGRQVVKARIAQLKALNIIEEGKVAYQAVLGNTQDEAEILLYTEARLGEILAKIPQKKPIGFSGGNRMSLPDGINKKQSHYAQELSKNEDAIAEVIAKAREVGKIPVRNQVLKLVQANKPKPETPPLPKDQYNVIYADPPWEYSNSGLLGSAKQHYPTMSIDELCQLAVPEISDTNAILFMWVTNPLLFECVSVVFEWGFQYKTNICWSKQGRGTYGKLGFYVSGKHELLLICTKGSFLPAIKPDSVLELPKSKHSRKPDEVYSIIEKMYPDGKYVELFARQKRQGWSSWGNEV